MRNMRVISDYKKVMNTFILSFTTKLIMHTIYAYVVVVVVVIHFQHCFLLILCTSSKLQNKTKTRLSKRWLLAVSVIALKCTFKVVCIYIRIYCTGCGWWWKLGNLKGWLVCEKKTRGFNVDEREKQRTRSLALLLLHSRLLTLFFRLMNLKQCTLHY